MSNNTASSGNKRFKVRKHVITLTYPRPVKKTKQRYLVPNILILVNFPN